MILKCIKSRTNSDNPIKTYRQQKNMQEKDLENSNILYRNEEM